MELRTACSPRDEKNYDTSRLREEFLIDDLFEPDEIKLVYSQIDRIITGSAVPVKEVLHLTAGDELRAEYFLQRREMGVINIGGDGVIVIDGKKYDVDYKQGMYIGMGAKEISFASKEASKPAKFYINSAPAHKTYPTVYINYEKANHKPMGDEAHMNKRVINQYIHKDVCQSCQLAMGMTELAVGSSWNTMPCHTHERRMEVYFYFNFPETERVFHIMGRPDETRHIIMAPEQAVISPSWSIHCAAATMNYTFIWGMCGENQEYDDQDWFETKDLK